MYSFRIDSNVFVRENLCFVIFCNKEQNVLMLKPMCDFLIFESMVLLCTADKIHMYNVNYTKCGLVYITQNYCLPQAVAVGTV